MTSAPPPTSLPTTTIDYDYYDNTGYTYIPAAAKTTVPPILCIEQADCVTLVVVNVIIVLLGLLGNGLVIWVIGYRMRKRRTVTTTWYLSLALSVCATLPFNIHLQATRSWNFGLFMCKFTSFVLYLNMFSSIFLMLIISVDRCVSVVYPFWARTNRTMTGAAVTVVVAWLFSMLLSIPSLVFRDTIEEHNQVIQCYNNFGISVLISTSIPVFRFVLGFVFPMVIITGCYSIIIKTIQNNRMARSAMPFKVMTALIVTFVICWLPYHIFVLLEMNFGHNDNTFISTGMIISVTLVQANSCMNPLLYAFMGKDIKRNLWNAFILKMENTFSEERPSESSNL